MTSTFKCLGLEWLGGATTEELIQARTDHNVYPRVDGCRLQARDRVGQRLGGGLVETSKIERHRGAEETGVEISNAITRNEPGNRK